MLEPVTAQVATRNIGVDSPTARRELEEAGLGMVLVGERKAVPVGDPVAEPVDAAAVAQLVEAATRHVFAPDPLADPASVLAEPAPADDPASVAAGRAGVVVRAVDTHLDVAAAVGVLDAVFGRTPGHHFYPPSLLRNLLAAGAPVLLAWQGDEPVGVVLALPGWTADSRPLLQSGPMAVLPSVRGRGVSVALKLAQRAWAVERGVTEIRWSFDAMAAVNARLNLHRLGATVEAFLPGYDGIRHPADDTPLPYDRLLVAWHIAGPAVPGTGTVDPVWAVAAGTDGMPRLDPSWAAGAEALVAVPADVAALRQTAPAAASAWQHAVGQVLREAIAGGWQVTWDDRGGYRLSAPASGPVGLHVDASGTGADLARASTIARSAWI